MRRPRLESILASPLRTVLAALVIASVPVALVAAAAIDATDQRARAEKVAQAETAAARSADQLAEILRHLEQGLVSFAATPSVREAVAARSQAATAVLLAEVRPLLPQEIFQVFSTDREGVLLAIDPPVPAVIGQSFAFRDYFMGVSRDWRPYVSDTYVTKAPGIPPAVAIAVPVFDASTRPVGVLAVAIDLERAGTQWFARLQASFDDVYVVDNEGLVITRVGTPGADTRRDLSADAAVAGARSGERVRRLVDDFAGAGPMLVASAPVGTTGWQLFVADSPSKLQSAVAPLRNVLAAVSFTLVLLIVAGALAVSFAARGLIAQRQRLADLNEELKAAGQHKSEFLANMSHELRTPLNAILGFSDLLDEQLRASVTARQRLYLGNIHAAGKHLLSLIDDILDLSKVEAGRVELRREITALVALIEPVVATARAAADAASVSFDSAIESAQVNVDIGRTRQILYNLLSNAVKFTPAGGRVALRVWTEGSDLHAEVKDTGIGIPADRHSRVFGVFERVNEDRSDSKGTGLGLALTKRLVELHGGDLSFASGEGTGTCFSLVLSGAVVSGNAGERVLVVEDDPRSADLTLAIAASAGSRSELATTVEAALAAIARRPPVAVLLDLQLAGGRGETVLREMRASAATREVPIAILSVEDDDGHVRALGADEYFTKPLDRERLRLWLIRVAEGAAVSSAA